MATPKKRRKSAYALKSVSVKFPRLPSRLAGGGAAENRPDRRRALVSISGSGDRSGRGDIHQGPALSSVGPGAEVGIRSDSSWNNPEPEIVPAVDRQGEALGASLGNDVNLRDFEGRSALLRAKLRTTTRPAASVLSSAFSTRISRWITFAAPSSSSR